MSCFLGIDGGGTKTAFLLIDGRGEVLATHEAGPAYYLEIGLPALRTMLAQGIGQLLQRAGRPLADLRYSFIGLPAYGEDSRLQHELDAIATPLLPRERYACGNDAVCGWAGALGGEDGIHLICGTGSMAYGQAGARVARSGGWGELFSDEGSAYWIAREGLTLFSRMSDGRLAQGPLHKLLQRHFVLEADLDLCGAIYGAHQARSQLAALCPLIAEAAAAGDTAAQALFVRAAEELAQMVDAVRASLSIDGQIVVPVSYSGGLFRQSARLLTPLRAALAARANPYSLQTPRYSPVAGAALYAARLAGAPLSGAALEALAKQTS